jgi:thiol-disulfide isomerase/thioredoxin
MAQRLNRFLCKNQKMKTLLILLLSPFALLAQSTTADPSSGGQVDVVKFSYLDSLGKSKSDTTYVINFWATWCGPCVHELPNFEKLNADYAGKKVKVILVSMDFPNTLNSRLIPFVKEKGMKAKVVLMNDPDYNSWIDRIDKSWSGGLPATLIVNGSTKRHEFYEKELTYDELNKLLNP